MSWPFPEPPTQPCYATQGIIERTDAISWIYHDPEDLSWQFQGEDPASEPVLMALGSMLDLYPWLTDLADLEPGWTATLGDGVWEREPLRELLIENVVDLHADHPDKFELLPERERASLKKGDLAKLSFFLQDGADFGRERMWVEVQKASRGAYLGKLRNQPVRAGQIEDGDDIEFGPEHVLEIERKFTKR